MNLDQTLLAISNPNDDNLTIAGISAAKQNWSAFYLELESLIDQFIADDTSLTQEQEPILFFGTLLLAELKYSPALEKCLHLFARSDSILTPLETVFGETITELTPTLFFNVADGNTQALCNFISDGHQSMYGKGAAIEAVFAQYEVGIIDKNELEDHVRRWLASFLAIPSAINSFLMSVLADCCVQYQLNTFKSQFNELCDKDLLDEERFESSEVKAWNNSNTRKFVESGMVQTDFNMINTLQTWIENDYEDEELDDIDSLMEEGGLLDSILYDENTILKNSVPVSSLATAGRNDPCPCGSGKKFKKCCLQ
ncbi:DUF1186 domain-containing protein [Pseudocolwellia sp. AS88]|uniref:DUF1186 domain-containing protein n=1 Tax=Pseudocolwellia sp. AS88 TaxID=3063958 RepID=UPI0026F258AC|nr:DUF1186 domain-containing protein [Pseudocolwellia sp. AS88]MDO7084893.1 DUF1186 domain-containing protein [Pseudocolwellia sp. AS88]